MQLPIPGDLISIDREVSGVLISGDPELRNKRWAMSLVSISAEQNGLVLETYNPKALARDEIARAADELLQAQQERLARKVSPDKRPPYKKVPDEIRVIVIVIGTNIIETIYDPEYMSIINL